MHGLTFLMAIFYMPYTSWYTFLTVHPINRFTIYTHVRALSVTFPRIFGEWHAFNNRLLQISLSTENTPRLFILMKQCSNATDFTTPFRRDVTSEIPSRWQGPLKASRLRDPPRERKKDDLQNEFKWLGRFSREVRWLLTATRGRGGAHTKIQTDRRTGRIDSEVRTDEVGADRQADRLIDEMHCSADSPPDPL